MVSGLLGIGEGETLRGPMGLRSDCLERGREVCSGDVSESGWGIDDL